MKKYYYADELNSPVGPISAEALLELHRTGVINSATLVTEESPENWIPLYEHSLTSAPMTPEPHPPLQTKPLIARQSLAPAMPAPTSTGREPHGIYTEEDANRARWELDEWSAWSIFLVIIGSIVILGAVITFQGINIYLLISLIAFGLSCFFAAHLVNRFKDIYIFQRESYYIEVRRELSKAKATERVPKDGGSQRVQAPTI